MSVPLEKFVTPNAHFILSHIPSLSFGTKAFELKPFHCLWSLTHVVFSHSSVRGQGNTGVCHATLLNVKLHFNSNREQHE